MIHDFLCHSILYINNYSIGEEEMLSSFSFEDNRLTGVVLHTYVFKNQCVTFVKKCVIRVIAGGNQS